MSSQTMTPEADLPAAAKTAPAALPWTRVFYWSVRRELWEHRSIWIAPLVAAGVALVGFFLSSFHLNRAVHASMASMGPTKAGMLILIPYLFVTGAVILVSFIVAVVYSQGALHQERRDRSVLFWKSLPVSDLITVASKAFLPIVVLPVAMFAVIFVTHLIMMAWGAVVIGAAGGDVGGFLSRTHAPLLWKVLALGLPYMVLWWAPIFGWLMMASAWFKRVPWLWAFGGPAALALIEKLAFDTNYIGGYLKLRFAGAIGGAFSLHDATRGGVIDDSAPLDLSGWADPNLWIGLVAAAVFLAVAVRLRRQADPI